MPTLLMDVVRLTCWLMILALAFGPLEWLCTLRERSGRRRGILVDLGYYYLKHHGLFETLDNEAGEFVRPRRP